MTRTLTIIAIVCSLGTAASARPEPEPRLKARNNHVIIEHQTSASVPTIGPPLAPVTIEFFCRVADRYTSRRIYRKLMLLHKRHPTRLRIVFHLVGYGRRYLAKAALGAHLQGKFRAFMDAMWKLSYRFRQPDLEALVKRIGLDWPPISAWSPTNDSTPC